MHGKKWLGATMQHDADSKPIRPDAAFQRINNANKWNQEHEGDDRFMNEYNRSNVQIATQENLFGMMALLQTNYGGWNSNKGDRNYL